MTSEARFNSGDFAFSRDAQERIIEKKAQEHAAAYTLPELEQKAEDARTTIKLIDDPQFKNRLAMLERAIAIKKEEEAINQTVPSTEMLNIARLAEAARLRERLALLESGGGDGKESIDEKSYEKPNFQTNKEYFGEEVYYADTIVTDMGADELSGAGNPKGLTEAEREQYFTYLRENKIDIIRHVPHSPRTTKESNDTPVSYDMTDAVKNLAQYMDEWKVGFKQNNNREPSAAEIAEKIKDYEARQQSTSLSEKATAKKSNISSPLPAVPRQTTAQDFQVPYESEMDEATEDAQSASHRVTEWLKNAWQSHTPKERLIGGAALVVAATSVITAFAVHTPEENAGAVVAGEDVKQADEGKGERIGTIEQLGGCIDLESREAAAIQGTVSGTVDIALTKNDGSIYKFERENAPAPTPSQLSFEGSGVFLDVCASGEDVITVGDRGITIDRSKVFQQVLVYESKPKVIPVDAPVIDQLGIGSEDEARLKKVLEGDIRKSFASNGIVMLNKSILDQDTVKKTYDKILLEGELTKKQIESWAEANNATVSDVTLTGEYTMIDSVNGEVDASKDAYALKDTAKVTKLDISVAAEKKG